MLERMWEKREPSYTVGGSVNWCSHYAKHHRVSPQKLKIELACNPAVSLLSIYLEKNGNTNFKRYMHPSVQSRYGNSPSAHQQTTGLRRCDICLPI